MILHPNITADHCDPGPNSYPYLGFRDRVRPPVKPGVKALQPKYSFPQIALAIGRTQQAWATWVAPEPDGSLDPAGKVRRGLQGRVPRTNMPEYVSAYMALLDDAHPTYALRRDWLNKLKDADPRLALQFPPIPEASEEDVRALMERHSLTDADVFDLLGLPYGNRRYSIRTLGNDGVRWVLLRLAVDEAPQMKLFRRGAQSAPAVRLAPATVRTASAVIPPKPGAAPLADTNAVDPAITTALANAPLRFKRPNNEAWRAVRAEAEADLIFAYNKWPGVFSLDITLVGHQIESRRNKRLSDNENAALSACRRANTNFPELYEAMKVAVQGQVVVVP